MKATIKDIARIAGVSTATVSKIINHKDEHISEATRALVRSIILEHKFIPNRAASSLITKKTKTIGILIPDIADFFLPELVKGAEEKATELGYSLLLCTTNNEPEREQKAIELLQEKMVDGMIFSSSVIGSEIHLNTDLPLVRIDRESDLDCYASSIRVYNEQGAYNAVEHLIAGGYKKIIHIGGPETSSLSQERLTGFKMALIDHQLDYDDSYIFSGDFSFDWGYSAVNLLIKEKIPFDALFCGSDTIAVGALKGLLQQGLNVPSDIGLVGFDDIELSRMVEPALTTVKQPSYEMGYTAVEMLEQMIRSKERKTMSVAFETQLIIRESTRGIVL